MRKASRRRLHAVGALGALLAALGMLAGGLACTVPDLDEAGKQCTDRCPGGLPCVNGTCGGTADGSTDAPTGEVDGEPDAACTSAPSVIELGAVSVPTNEIDLAFTKGPPYTIQRKNTNGVDEAGAFTTIAQDLPPGTATYEDRGQSPGAEQTSDAGLNARWRYTYQLVVLTCDGGVDPRFTDLTVSVETWADAGVPPADGSATDETEETAH